MDPKIEVRREHERYLSRMDFSTLTWLLCGLATVYPYYRFAVKPRTECDRRRGKAETSWRDLDPIFFLLVTVLMWPLCVLTVGLALYTQRLERRERGRDVTHLPSAT
jgi:hypothetical protein